MTIDRLRPISQSATWHFHRVAKLAALIYVVVSVSVPFCFGQDTKSAVKVSQDNFRKEVFVVKVVDVGAQWKDKIEVGDQIVSADGQPIKDREALIKFVQNAGDKPIFIELLHHFEPKTIEVVPKNRKIGIAVANPREYALSNAEEEPVKLATRAEILDDPASSGDGVIQVPPGTIVLSVFTETAGVIPVYFLSGNNQGEVWWVKSESVKPKSAVATRTSWFMYLLAAGLAITIFSQRHRRNISTIMAILVAAVICRLISDNAARLPIAVTAILFVKSILGVVSIICGLGAFAVTIKWMREPDIDGGSTRRGSALGMLLFGLFAGAKLWDVFSQNREREKDQSSELPPHTVEEFVVALRNSASRFNAKPTKGEKKSNISIADDHLSYFGYELRWILTKRVLCALASTSTKIADLLKHAAKMGDDAGYKLIDKALYVKTWKGFVETENGKELILWDDNSTRGIAEIVIEEFVQSVNREIGTPENRAKQKSGFGGRGGGRRHGGDDDDGDGDGDDDGGSGSGGSGDDGGGADDGSGGGDGDGDSSFREWLRSPTWLSVDEAIQQAPSVGLTSPAIEALQLCGGRNVAVSKYGLLVTLERSEAISEAHVEGHGVVAIEQRDYPELHRELRAKLQNQGYTVLYNETGKENLLILKASDQYQLLRLMGGVAYQIAEDVIEKLREWDETYKLSLTLRGFAEDWVQADIVAPCDVRSLAEDIHRFCPDIAEHESRPIKAIMGDLTNSQYIHLWWD